MKAWLRRWEEKLVLHNVCRRHLANDTDVKQTLTYQFSPRNFDGIKIITTFTCMSKLSVNLGITSHKTLTRTSIAIPSVISVLLHHNTVTMLIQFATKCHIFLIGNTKKCDCITCEVIRFMLWLVCLEPLTACRCTVCNVSHHRTSVEWTGNLDEFRGFPIFSSIDHDLWHNLQNFFSDPNDFDDIDEVIKRLANTTSAIANDIEETETLVALGRTINIDYEGGWNIYFVFDASNSVGLQYFEKGINFAKALVSKVRKQNERTYDVDIPLFLEIGFLLCPFVPYLYLSILCNLVQNYLEHKLCTLINVVFQNDMCALRAPKLVHCLFLFALVLGKIWFSHVKLLSFLYSLDNFLLKNVIVFFFGNQISK